MSSYKLPIISQKFISPLGRLVALVLKAWTENHKNLCSLPARDLCFFSSSLQILKNLFILFSSEFSLRYLSHAQSGWHVWHFSPHVTQQCTENPVIRIRTDVYRQLLGLKTHILFQSSPSPSSLTLCPNPVEYLSGSRGSGFWWPAEVTTKCWLFTFHNINRFEQLYMPLFSVTEANLLSIYTTYSAYVKLKKKV